MFPDWVQKVSMAVPTCWVIDDLDAMTWRGQGLEAAGAAMTVQLGFALLFVVLAVSKFKRDQRERRQGVKPHAASAHRTYKFGASQLSSCTLSTWRRCAMSANWSAPILPTTKYFESGCAR